MKLYPSQLQIQNTLVIPETFNVNVANAMQICLVSSGVHPHKHIGKSLERVWNIVQIFAFHYYRMI